MTVYAVPADAVALALADGVPVTVAVSAPGQNATITFDGIADDRVSLEFSSSFGCSGQVQTPSGAPLWSTSLCNGFLDAIVLPETGTYTLALDPPDAQTGSATVTLYTVPDDAVAVAEIDGGPVSVDITVPGQSGAVTFEGAIGDRVAMQMEQAFFGLCDAEVIAPSGATAWTSRQCGSFFDVAVLAEDGTYTVHIDPRKAVIGTVTTTVHRVPDDVEAVVEAGGDPVTFEITAPGQNAVVTFDGTAGDGVSMEVGPSSCPRKTLVAPSGSTVAARSSCQYTDLTDLPEDGTYRIELDPLGPGTESITLTLNVVPAEAIALVTLDGEPATIDLVVVGHKGVFTFDGTAGETVALDLTYTFARCGIGVELAAPSDAVVWRSWCPSTIGPTVLAETGTYSLRFDPFDVPSDDFDPADPDEWDQTGSVTATLRSVPN